MSPGESDDSGPFPKGHDILMAAPRKDNESEDSFFNSWLRKILQLDFSVLFLLADALDLLVGLLGVLRVLEPFYLHHLVEERAGIVQADIRIGVIGWIALRLFQRYQLESLLLE